ncbi:cold-shock DNA-binding protein family [Lacibacter cauensis]|uniref:Cold-shock DNA-binding protein family n=1 Tax=Lacibacter cauensis TaxID=510947 RepID=A0A562SUT7_9BACT|nr:cold shock domain-containing protein [Lacibacter cauensis]TWI85031.1 cold-shock DNA-binding protein family [Lacibacter cauensis]
MAETWNKKEREKKKQQSKKEKAERKQERKENAKGKTLDDMLAYIDENGNISDTPPDLSRVKKVKLEDIEIGVPKQQEQDPADAIRTGIVSNFNESKGYGFIKDLESGESIFVHINNLAEPIKENNKVTFEIERTHKGLSAVNVKRAV